MAVDLHHTNRFGMVTPHCEHKVMVNVSVIRYIKFSSANPNGNIVSLDDPGRVRSQIISVVLQIQGFDFECNLVLSRKLIIASPPALRSNSLWYSCRY
jgi:hypothetical protein